MIFFKVRTRGRGHHFEGIGVGVLEDIRGHHFMDIDVLVYLGTQGDTRGLDTGEHKGATSIRGHRTPRVES